MDSFARDYKCVSAGFYTLGLCLARNLRYSGINFHR